MCYNLPNQLHSKTIGGLMPTGCTSKIYNNEDQKLAYKSKRKRAFTQKP